MKLYEKYEWVPTAYKDRPVEEFNPAFLRMVVGMGKIFNAVNKRRAETVNQKPAS